MKTLAAINKVLEYNLKAGRIDMVSTNITNLVNEISDLLPVSQPESLPHVNISDEDEEQRMRKFSKNLSYKEFPNDVNRAYDYRCGAYDALTQYTFRSRLSDDNDKLIIEKEKHQHRVIDRAIAYLSRMPNTDELAHHIRQELSNLQNKKK